MKLIFSLGQDLFEQFCFSIKSPIVSSSDKKIESEIVELLSTALRHDNVSATLLHVLHVTLIGKKQETNFFLCQIFNYFSLIFKFAGTYYLHLLVVFKYFKVINECFCTFSALLDAPTNFVRQCLPHLSEFQKTVMNFWQRIVAHSNIFQDTDWNYFFDLTSLSTILIAQTLGHVITTGENDLKFVHDVPRDEREFLKSKLFENGLEESYPENGSLSKYFDN